MPDGLTVDIAVAVATLVAPAVFLAVLAYGGRRRSRGLVVGPRLSALVTVLGGVCLGLFLLLSGDLLVSWPILAAVLVLWLVLVQRGAWRLAFWLLAGVAMPWTVVSGLALSRGAAQPDPLGLGQTWLGFLVGAGIIFLTIATAVIKRAPAVEAAVAAGRARPTGRSFGDVGAAVRAPAIVGPFGLSEVALLVAVIVAWVVVGLLLPASVPEPARLVVLVVLGAALGAEAFIRAMPAPAREAFEAFSWLGEWELAQVRAQTGGGVPTNAPAARRWLLAHRDQPDLDWVRVEMLAFVQRFDEAKAVAERMPETDPAERVEKAIARDFADWFAGGPGDLAGIEAAAQELLPPDGDARLRAEVAIAIANVRRRIADGEDPIAAGQPLRDVRRRLGRRADGQVGRALRGRLFRPLLLVSGLFAVVSLLLPDLGI
ncbi:MAG TPA: hypothetical protein VL749_03020 [Patescibacteria group bacterium]|nr:hypothetical protein [Patescibacteria group bacterium]